MSPAATALAPGESEQLDAIFAALAHPARRAILTRLAAGPATVSELGAPLEMSQPAVSRHLRVLGDAGLVATGRDAQARPRALVPETLALAEEWVSAFREIWEARLDRLGAYLADATAGGAPGGPEPGDDATASGPVTTDNQREGAGS